MARAREKFLMAGVFAAIALTAVSARGQDGFAPWKPREGVGPALGGSACCPICGRVCGCVMTPACNVGQSPYSPDCVKRSTSMEDGEEPRRGGAPRRRGRSGTEFEPAQNTVGQRSRAKNRVPSSDSADDDGKDADLSALPQAGGPSEVDFGAKAAPPPKGQTADPGFTPPPLVFDRGTETRTPSVK